MVCCLFSFRMKLSYTGYSTQYSTLHIREFAVAICRKNLQQEFAAWISWLFSGRFFLYLYWWANIFCICEQILFIWKQHFFICEENFHICESFFINNVSFCYCCGSYWLPYNAVVTLLTINKSLFFELYGCLYPHCQTSTKNMFKFKSIHHTLSHKSGILYNNVMVSSYNRNSSLIISINLCAIFKFKTTQSNLKNHLTTYLASSNIREKWLRYAIDTFAFDEN